jgi:hypothetical protein
LSIAEGTLICTPCHSLPPQNGVLFNGDLLPISPENGFAMAGDVRALENPVLTSLQVLLLREHNRLLGDPVVQDFLDGMCGWLDPILRPRKADHCLFYHTRALVTAIYNHINYQARACVYLYCNVCIWIECHHNHVCRCASPSHKHAHRSGCLSCSAQTTPPLARSLATT